MLQYNSKMKHEEQTIYKGRKYFNKQNRLDNDIYRGKLGRLILTYKVCATSTVEQTKARQHDRVSSPNEGTTEGKREGD